MSFDRYAFFTPFIHEIVKEDVPTLFNDPFDYTPHPLCLMATKELQFHLENQTEWQHNFGLDEKEEGTVIGKMFGVLVVQCDDGEIGYLSAFSGKLAGGNHHNKFVPPVFDSLTEDGFLNAGMVELSEISKRIKMLEVANSPFDEDALQKLRTDRKEHSNSVLKLLYDSYTFLNSNGEKKSLREIFQHHQNGNPPGGAGECAAPKLLQFAFLHNMKPLAMAEFWWGLSPKTETWKHKAFYPSCKEKCGPILGFMLGDL